MGVMKIVTGKLGESYIYIYTDEGDMKSESSSRAPFILFILITYSLRSWSKALVTLTEIPRMNQETGGTLRREEG
ncbi:unnamed protein product [Brassica oleracea]